MVFGPYNTVWPADSIEFCPIDGYINYFACATYKLLDEEERDPGVKDRQQRRGRCLLYKLSQESDLTGPLDSPPIFPALPDLKWCHQVRNRQPILAAADSEGNINLLELENDSLRTLATSACAGNNVLCLSLDWRIHGPCTEEISSSNWLAVSCSDGTISILKPSNSGLSLNETWTAHDFEPWITAWDRHELSVIYSGGDDCKWKGWDIRTPLTSPTFVNKRFEGGVTSIQSNPHIEYLVAVGSYDSHLRLFDVRKPQSPIQTIDVGGGVWRIKWHPSPQRQRDALLACMHDGFKVVHSVGEGEIQIVSQFDKHTSLAYGADWSWNEVTSSAASTVIASCSFYDCSMYLWEG